MRNTCAIISMCAHRIQLWAPPFRVTKCVDQRATVCPIRCAYLWRSNDPFWFVQYRITRFLAPLPFEMFSVRPLRMPHVETCRHTNAQYGLLHSYQFDRKCATYGLVIRMGVEILVRKKYLLSTQLIIYSPTRSIGYTNSEPVTLPTGRYFALSFNKQFLEYLISSGHNAINAFTIKELRLAAQVHVAVKLGVTCG